jgi:ABC-type proline/glycine betaine transport system permease subunit
MLGGSILVAALALVLEAVFALLQRVSIPAGVAPAIRKERA